MPKLPKSQLEFLAKKRDAAFKEQPGLAKLEKILLAHGGQAVVYVGYEDDLKPLLQFGESFSPAGAILEKGQESQCHWNTAQLWHANRDGGFIIVTGYALSKDDLWRQHTWGLWLGKVVETTVKRTLYYGYMLSDEQSEEFYMENL